MSPLDNIRTDNDNANIKFNGQNMNESRSRDVNFISDVEIHLGNIIHINNVSKRDLKRNAWSILKREKKT